MKSRPALLLYSPSQHFVPLRHIHRLFLWFRSWSAYAFDNLTFLHARAFVFVRGVSGCACAGRSVSTAGQPGAGGSQLAQKPGTQLITLDQAIQMALEHNHNLLAARTTIQQNEAEEITANLRPNPVLLGDSQFLPIFQPHNFSADYLDNTAQFDIAVSYLFERGRKRSTGYRRRRTRLP